MKKLLGLLMALMCTLTINATDLFLVGDATPVGWNIGDASHTTQMMYVGGDTYQWYGYLKTGGEGFKISDDINSWGEWHPSTPGKVLDQNGDTMVETSVSGDTKWQVPEDGTYLITIVWGEKRIVLNKYTPYSKANAEGVYEIGTATELYRFAVEVSHGAVPQDAKAVLTADIDCSSNYGTMTMGMSERYPFKGEFDGQGHKITLGLKDYRPRTALFAFIYGATIKNLVVDGNITMSSRNCAGGLCGRVDGGAKINNCLVLTNITDSQNGDGTIGGLCTDGHNTQFTNCAFMGSIKAAGRDGNGCLMGYANGGSGLRFVNCLVAPAEITWSGGATIGRNAPTIENCYATSAVPANDFTYANDATVKEMTDALLASGEGCYLLNESVSGAEGWLQTLPGDVHPFPCGDHAKVYANGDLNCDGTSKGNVTFSNTEGENRDAHTFENGICAVCHANEAPEKVDGVYQIANAGNLCAFSALVNGGENGANALVTADIDLAGVAYTPISTDANKFHGTFDGGQHRIKNMVLNGNERGLFWIVTGGGVVKNVIIDSSCQISGGKSNAGLIGCTNNTNYGNVVTIENCGNEATVTGDAQNNAGIIGCNYDGGLSIIIKNCYNTGNITSGWEGGAFSGWLGNASENAIINSWNTGTVTGGEPIARGNWNNENNYDADAATPIVQTGELCYKLGTPWTQDLATEAHPYPWGTAIVYAYSDGTYGNVEAPDSKFEAWDGENAVIIPANKWTSAYDAHSVTYTADYGYGDWNTGNPNYNVIIGTPSVDAAGKNWYEVGYNMLSSTDSWVYNQFDPRFGPNENPGDVYVVRYFTANGELPETVYLAAPHDDAPCEYYINGVKVFSRTGYEGVDGWFEDEVVRLNDEQKALIKTDGTKNVFAFHVHQNWGGRFADGGLYTEDTNAAKRFLNDDARKRLENAVAQAKTVEGFDAEVIAYAEERTTYIQEAGRALDKIRFELRKALAPRHDFSAIASATPADGLECYIYNEATGQFLAGGNDWGTHTTVEYFMGTRPMVLHANTSGANRFAIQTNLPNGIRGNADGLGHNGYVDCPHGDDFYSNEGWAWTFEALEDGTYHIIQSGREGDAYKYLGVREDARYQVDTDCPGDESAWNKWRIISKEQMEALVATASEDNGVDMSYKIHQANFSQNDFDGDNKDIANGDLNDSAWERNAGSIWNWKGNDAMGDYVFEAWFTPADVDLKLSQVIEGLPAGNYKVGVTGYYRDGNYDSAIDGNNRQLAYLYAGTQDNQVLLPSILDGAGKGAGWGNANHMECLIPDGCREAPKFFQLGTYKTEIDAVVGEDGKLEIGVCRPGEGVFERDWVVVDNFTLTYYGEPYTPAEFVSITPAPEDGEITLDTEFVVTFTEAVEFNEDASGIGMGAGFVNPTLFEKSEDGKVITVKFDKETLAEMLGGEISDIHALDEFSEGKFYVELFGVKDARTGEKLAGNSEDKTPGIYHWDYTSGETTAPALIVTPAEGQVEKLDVIKFESTGNFIFPSSYEGTDITITDADGNVVATITQDDLTDGAQVDPELMYPTSVVVELPEAITAGGTYTMTIPANAFYMSYSMQSNEATTVVYTIEEPVVLVADPAEGTVDGLQTVTIALSNNDLLTPSCSQDIVVTDADGNVVVTIDREDLSDYVTLNEDYMPTAVALPINILKQGTYTMTIPAGTFYCGMSSDANEETTFTWTVTGVLDGINNISTTDDVKTYNLGGQRVKANAKGIVIKNGKKYVVK